MKALREEIYVQPKTPPWYPRANQNVDRQSGCEVMAIFENAKNIRYRYHLPEPPITVNEPELWQYINST